MVSNFIQYSSKYVQIYSKTILPFQPSQFYRFQLYFFCLYNTFVLCMTRKIICIRLGFSSAKEWIEPHDHIIKKVIELSQLIRSAKHPILFTGAGCSTSIGIPDYRSGADTIVGTGPGIWNRKKQETPPKLRIDEIVDKAVPSLTHMAIKTLIDKQIFKYLVSQNTDGLHLRSGVRFNKISQLHGNRNLQKCQKCQRKYFRDFRTIRRGNKPDQAADHKTGRSCENCGGDLMDSIIYFGEKLPTQDLKNAFEHAARCDLLLCIGSSLTVRPSANVPVLALKNSGRLCIVNIQETPFDPAAQIKINGFCDHVMKQLMNQLSIEIDPYMIEHFLEMEAAEGEVKISGKDREGNNFTFIKSIICNDQEHNCLGHSVKMPIDHSTHELIVNFYGSKIPLCLYLPAYYKLYHGEHVRLKIFKRHFEQNWSIEEC